MKTISGRKIYSVSEINYFARQTLEQMTTWVEGEVSTYQTNPNWFYAFFTIKDENDVLPCFIEPQKLAQIKSFVVGKKVILYGVLTLFKKNEYKLKVFQIEEISEGFLDKQLKELYEKLKSEGLFETSRKKILPLYPKKICIVTSVGSAGWNDFKTHTADKFPTIELYSVNVKVEGKNSIIQLLSILPKVDVMGFDILVITRGGGSEESLSLVFNDEQIVRAIYNLKTPKIVAIGHEINTTLSELVADVRASTPTDAANIVTSAWQTVLEKLAQIQEKLLSKKDSLVDANLERLDYIYSRLFSTRKNITRFQERLVGIGHSLKILSPQNTLDRGYSITTDKDNKIIKSAQYVVVGDIIGVRLARGYLRAKLTEIKDGKIKS